MIAPGKRAQTADSTRRRMHNIFVGVENNDFAEVDAAISEEAESITSREPSLGMTALHLAVGDGNMKMVLHLLSKPGIDPSIRDYAERSPIDLAIGIGRTDIVDTIARVIYPKSFSASPPLKP